MIGDALERHAARAATDVAALAMVLLAFGVYVAAAFVVFRLAQWAARVTSICAPATDRASHARETNG